jgi:hypothetical protein
MGQTARYREFGSDWLEWLERFKARERRREERAAAAGYGGPPRGEGGGGVDWSGVGGGGAWAREDERDEGNQGVDWGQVDGDEDEAGGEEEEESGDQVDSGGEGSGGVDRRRSLSVVGGIVVNWPGGPSKLDLHVLRAQRAAARLYAAGTAGLLDGYWRRQLWFREEGGPGSAAVGGGTGDGSGDSSSSNGSNGSGGGGRGSGSRGRERAG